MDFWYYFLHKSLDVTNNKGIISFITSRYWLNSDGAKKIIDRMNKDTTLINVADIGKLKVFDNVAGHHMVHMYSKAKNNDAFVYKKVENDIRNIVLNEDAPNLKISKLYNSKVFIDDEIILNDGVFSKIINTVPLGDLFNVSQGVVEASDRISSKALKNCKNKKNYVVGQGVFVLEQYEFNALNFSLNEKSIFRNYIDPNDVEHYKINYQGKKLLYSDSLVKELIKSDSSFSKIKSHLGDLNEFITSSNKPYGLHRPREKRFFESDKIIFKGMFKEPQFSLDSTGLYFGFSFSSIIQNDKKCSLKYLLAILNSKLGMVWFSDYGKHRGTGVDIGVKKLRKFPVIYQKKYVELIDAKVDEILSLKDKNQDVSMHVEELDIIICCLYQLGYNEFLEVDSDFEKIINESEYLKKRKEWS